MSRLWPIAAVLIAVLAVTSGCNFFRPAQPEPFAEAPFLPDYRDPDATLQTIADALSDKARTIGVTAYAGAFAESTSAQTPAYHHFFWPDDVFHWRQASGRPAPEWNFLLEQNFYIKFVNLRGDAYRLQWAVDDLNPDDVRDDQASVHRHYLVTTETEDGAISDTLAVGYADLTVIRSADSWRITRWDDRIDPNGNPNNPEAVTLGRRRLGTQ